MRRMDDACIKFYVFCYKINFIYDLVSFVRKVTGRCLAEDENFKVHKNI